ncbi:MAG: Zn-ribbon domain-containing OB-fold protein [Betaproteobacteria bacterium]|nr:Zn-ribbon domain-containing OB-fold protein [Betaproteobacteria bacterium]
MAQSQSQSLIPPGPEQTWKNKLAQGGFQLQKCAGCGKHVFYPRVICPHCGADRLEWVAASGGGTVYSTTVVRRKPEAGGDYNVALVDLAEGPRMMSRVVGVEPAAVKIGMKVKARVAEENAARIVEFTPD